MSKGQVHFDNLLFTNSQTERSRYTLAGRTIATRVLGDPTATNNGLFYIFSDHLGSTSVLATSSGNQVPGSKAAYYPFGSPRTTPTQTITDRNFTGQKENLELGLLYYSARFYLPAIGRFTSADTIVPDPQSPQSYNRYAYTFNNPLKFTDPSGHDPAWCADEYESRGNPACNHSQPNIPAPKFYSCQATGNQTCLSPNDIINSDGTIDLNGAIDAITHSIFGEGGSMSLQIAANVLQTLQNKAKIYWNCWKQITDVCSSHRWINGKSQIAWEEMTQEQYVALLLFVLSEDDGQGYGWPAYNAWRAPHEHGQDNWNNIRDAVSDLVTSAGQSRVTIMGVDDRAIHPNPAIENNVNVYRFASSSIEPTSNYPWIDYAGGRYQWYYTP